MKSLQVGELLHCVSTIIRDSAAVGVPISCAVVVKRSRLTYIPLKTKCPSDGLLAFPNHAVADGGVLAADRLNELERGRQYRMLEWCSTLRGGRDHRVI